VVVAGTAAAVGTAVVEMAAGGAAGTAAVVGRVTELQTTALTGLTTVGREVST